MCSHTGLCGYVETFCGKKKNNPELIHHSALSIHGKMAAPAEAFLCKARLVSSGAGFWRRAEKSRHCVRAWIFPV